MKILKKLLKNILLVLVALSLFLNPFFVTPLPAQEPQIYNMRLLYVVVNPVEGGRDLINTYFQGTLQRKTADEFVDYWANEWVNAFTRLSESTINYQVAKKLQITSFPKHISGSGYSDYTFETYYQDCILHGGPRTNCERQADFIDHVAFYQDNKICEIAEQENIDEIWINTPYALQAWEDEMVGPSPGFFTNGPSYVVSSCKKHYNVTLANLTRGGSFLHSYGHRLEGTLRYLSQNWRSEDYQKYIDNFAILSRYWSPLPYEPVYCGNVEIPHNAIKYYDVANRTYKNSNCVDWKNFPDFTGETEFINCETWGCDDAPWQEFWFGSLPRSAGWVEMTDKNGRIIYFKKNWWYYLLYPENAMNFVVDIPFSPEGLNYSLLGGTITLRWDTVPGAIKYALRVDDKTDGWNGNCSSPAGDFCADNITATSYSFTLTPGHQYQWWIHATNNYGWSWGNFGPEFSASSLTPTPTITLTPSPSPTSSPTPTVTFTPTSSPTSTPTPTPIPTPADVRVEVGEEEWTMGPQTEALDMPFFTVPYSGGIQGYSSSETRLYSGTNLNNLVDQGIVLRKGDNESDFDYAGAWLAAVYKLTDNHWLGWYHAETKYIAQPPASPATKQSIAFCESFDSGRTWEKGAQVIMADLSLINDDKKNDASDPYLVRVGDYFYLFFKATPFNEFEVHLARSLVSEEGKPGKWYKYYNGNFTEPGLGGHSSKIPNLAPRFVVYNSYLDRFIAPWVSGRWGFFFNYSAKFENNWQAMTVWNKNDQDANIYPMVSFSTDYTVDNWNWWTPVPNPGSRDEKTKSLYAYSSVINPDGDSQTTGQEFYLYYMKVFNKGDMINQKYLLRRKIKLYKNSTDPYFSKIALTRYEKTNPKKTKVSTEIAEPKEGYQKKATLGYLLPHEHTDFRALYECYIPTWNDYFVALPEDNPANFNWEHCRSTGDVFIRRIGWISTTQTPGANQPLYRCFDEQNTDHFVSLDQNCEGKRQEGLLGYLFSQTFNPTPTPILGDYDSNGKVNDEDLRFLFNNWNKLEADLNGDGKTNETDLTILLAHWQP